jgi:hypothetical protein
MDYQKQFQSQSQSLERKKPVNWSDPYQRTKYLQQAQRRTRQSQQRSPRLTHRKLLPKKTPQRKQPGSEWSESGETIWWTSKPQKKTRQSQQYEKQESRHIIQNKPSKVQQKKKPQSSQQLKSIQLQSQPNITQVIRQATNQFKNAPTQQQLGRLKRQYKGKLRNQSHKKEIDSLYNYYHYQKFRKVPWYKRFVNWFRFNF